jgi:hypothetical protein
MIGLSEKGTANVRSPDVALSAFTRVFDALWHAIFGVVRC